LLYVIPADNCEFIAHCEVYKAEMALNKEFTAFLAGVFAFCSASYGMMALLSSLNIEEGLGKSN